MATQNAINVDTAKSLLDDLNALAAVYDAKRGPSNPESQRAIKDAVLTENASDIEKAVKNFVTALNKMSPEVQLGVVENFRQIVDAVKPNVEALITERVKASVQTNPDAENDPRTVEQISEEYKDKRSTYGELRSVLIKMGFATETDLPEARIIRVGAGRKPGQTNKVRYQYFINGTPCSEQTNSLMSVASTATVGLKPAEPGNKRGKLGTKEFKTLLTENGVDLKAESWEYTLENGFTVSAKRVAVDSDDTDSVATSDTEDAA